jgi:hypothetical protein
MDGFKFDLEDITLILKTEICVIKTNHKLIFYNKVFLYQRTFKNAS